MPRRTPETPVSTNVTHEAVNDPNLLLTSEEMGYPSADCEEVLELLNKTVELDPTSPEVDKALERCREGLR